jgi:hypothetical protein
MLVGSEGLSRKAEAVAQQRQTNEQHQKIIRERQQWQARIDKLARKRLAHGPALRSSNGPPLGVGR